MINLGDGHALFLEAFHHPICEFLELGFGVHTSGNAGLIGDDNQQVAPFLKMPAGFKNPVYKLEIFFAINIAVIHVDHAIAVQKYGFVGHRFCS